MVPTRRNPVVANSAQRQVPRTGAGCAGRADQRTEHRRDLERRCCLSTVSACEPSEVQIIIDGSCLGNPGPGGWACILRYGEHERVLQGGVPDATNNRMELAAAIEGLRALKRTCQVTVLTDSDYVRRGITEFLPRWKNNGWRNASGRAVVNQDLWEQLDELVGYHEVTWLHVPGHSGQPDHERCDALANSAARAAKRGTSAQPS